MHNLLFFNFKIKSSLSILNNDKRSNGLNSYIWFMTQDPIIGGSLLLTYTTGYVAPLLLAASFAGALQVCLPTYYRSFY